MWVNVLSGLGIGFLGSFHCIGMCGPIALSLPVAGDRAVRKLWVITMYNAGRAATYALLGALFGAFGTSIFLVGYQQLASVLIGAGILVILLAGRFLSLESRFFSVFHLRIQQLLGRLLKAEKNSLSFLLTGMVNGLLPCGLVYLAVAAAVATGSAVKGAVLMAAFGAGTFPMMFTVMVMGRFISFSLRQKMKKAVPLFIGAMAVLMILRGLNLGIPMLSPAFQQTEQHEVKGCCHKE